MAEDKRGDLKDYDYLYDMYYEEHDDCEDDGDKESFNDLTVKITADVDEAVAGFKRLQRELRETTKAVRELESAYKDVEKASKNVATWYG